MTRLLVSVRNVDEARIARECGVDLIDLKEPDRGALGAVDFDEAARVAELLAGRTPMSMARGELRDDAAAAGGAARVPANVAYAKLGLTRCASYRAWPAAWLRWVATLPAATSPVAVVYADGAEVDAPSPEKVLETAATSRCRALLVDTAVKNGRTLADHWTCERLRRFIAEVHATGRLCVVGGSLDLASIPTVAACGADYVAVRGAACDGSRSGTLSPTKLRALRAALPM